MKVLTLNTHSWMEEHPEEKFEQLAEVILKEEYDVIALQEVNQGIKSEPGIVGDLYCPATDMVIHEDNFVLRLVDYLAANDVEYYWTWTFCHIGYQKFHEGLALLSKNPILPKDYLVSQFDGAEDHRRRPLLTGVTEIAGQMVRVCSVHYSWWSQEGFVTEWQNTVAVLKDDPYPLLVMGDFNNPEGTEGYQLVTASELGLMDTFVTSKKQIGSYTVSKAIDGWNDNQGNLRIDYIFATKEFVPKTYQVMFDGISGPVVSDHFGVAVTFN